MSTSTKVQKKVTVPGQALSNIATTLKMALAAIEGDEQILHIYKGFGITPEEVIRNQVEILNGLSTKKSDEVEAFLYEWAMKE